MYRHIVLGLVLTGFTLAQDLPPDTDYSPPFVLPEDVPAPEVSTQEIVTLTDVACIAPESQIFSIQTDTVIETGPLTVTPVCGQTVASTPSSTTETGSMTTAAIGSETTMETTVSTTTSASESDSGTTMSTSTESTTGTTTENPTSDAQSEETSAPAETQSGSPAERLAVGGVAGVLGLAAGVLVL